VAQVVVVPGGGLRVNAQYEITYLDGATGATLARYDRRESMPCLASPANARAIFELRPGAGAALVLRDPDGARRVLMPSVDAFAPCAVAPDGGRMAVKGDDGVVRVFDLGTGAELTRRDAPDAVAVVFTAHGLAVLRERNVQIIRDAGGDFHVTLPGRSEVAVASPDGHLLVVSRPEISQADVVDLRARTVVSSLSYASGAARFAFSPGGDRLLAAGILDGAMLAEWDVTPPPASPPIQGADRMGFRVSQDGRRIMVSFGDDPTRVRLFDERGALLRERILGDVPFGGGNVSADGTRFTTYTPTRVTVNDVASGEEIWSFDCDGCRRLEVSGDGNRLLTNRGSKELTVWDVPSRAAIWRETARAGAAREPLGISVDGRRVVWGREGRVYIHTLGGGDEELPLRELLQDAAFSYDGTRLAVVSTRSIGVWEVDGLRPVFRVPNPSSLPQDVFWSSDDSALLDVLDSTATVLLDSRTGRRIAAFPASKPASYPSIDTLSPTLTYKIARGGGTWDIRPLPSPDAHSPEDALARVLSEAGLEMRGVELVYAAPP
jgi:WD40 repeat protein